MKVSQIWILLGIYLAPLRIHLAASVWECAEELTPLMHRGHQLLMMSKDEEQHIMCHLK
jgi:hypothetical protein